MEKVLDNKIVEKLIMTIKAYESFREENEKNLEETVNFLRERLNAFHSKYLEEYSKKKHPSQKDRVMLEKFENFEAYLWLVFGYF